MVEIELSTHARQMMTERNIAEEWVWRTIHTPKRKRKGDDDNMHYTKPIKERQGRILHIVVNQNTDPPRIITVFFDRRLASK
ncbi:MAG TPA: DUF4258 domain-containing protein [Blastocatellia bacterium]|nr:DUF4258 domain-containing protein [Blastocatellia bacterium]